MKKQNKKLLKRTLYMIGVLLSIGILIYLSLYSTFPVVGQLP